MLNIKTAVVLGAILVIVSANPPNCADCIGDSLNADIATMDERRQCWYNRNSNYLTRIKLANMESIVATLREALNVANTMAEEKCRAIVPAQTCILNDSQDAMFECYVVAAKSLAVAHRDQEMCHGKAFNTEAMSIATRFIKGTNVGWKGIHPEC